MKKIIAYECVIFHTWGEESLAKMVNDKISEGFQPYGHPMIAGATAEDSDKHSQSDFMIIQAMVKYEK